MGNKQKTSADLFATAFTLSQCVDECGPDVKVLGNITAESICIMAADYVRLRLISGINNNEQTFLLNDTEQIVAARRVMTRVFAADSNFYEGYASQIAMLVHDKYDITDMVLRNNLAEDILHVIFYG